MVRGRSVETGRHATMRGALRRVCEEERHLQILIQDSAVKRLERRRQHVAGAARLLPIGERLAFLRKASVVWLQEEVHEYRMREDEMELRDGESRDGD